MNKKFRIFYKVKPFVNSKKLATFTVANLCV